MWRILSLLSIPGAFLAALIFVVHPVNVESVAWIAQRKNVLAMLFYLLSVLWYLKSNQQSARWSRWYWLSLLSFMVAMLSKGSVAVLPLVLLLLVWWRRPLTRWDLIRTAPFFAIAGVLTLVNIWFQSHGADIVLRKLTMLERLLGAGGVIWFYLYKILLPIQLNFFYSQWHIQAGDWRNWAPLIAAIVVTGLLIWQRNSAWGRPILVAWLYFCLCLVPVMGFTDVGYMKYSLVADHYQHLAIIGVIALIAAGWSLWRDRLKIAHRHWSTVVANATVALLIVLTYRQCELYRDVDTLYQSSPNSSLTQSSLGGIKMYRGQTEEAIQHYQEALKLNPNDEAAGINISLALAKLGRFDEALNYACHAVELWPDEPEAHNNLGVVLKQCGHLPDAISQYQEAIHLFSNFNVAYNNLGIALALMGRSDDAIENFQKALKINPHYADVHSNLGLALANRGRFNEAIGHYREAIYLNPDLLKAHKDLGVALLKSNHTQEAIQHLSYFSSKVSNDESVWIALMMAYDGIGQRANAVSAAEKAVSIARAQNHLDLVAQLYAF